MVGLKVLNVSFLLIWAGAACAQQVTTVTRPERVRGQDARGSAVELAGAKQTVTAAWNKYVKELGKGKTSGDLVAIASPALGGTVYEGASVYCRVSGSEETTAVWVGLLEHEWRVNDLSVVYRELEQFVHRFGIKFYRDQIQVQIDEAQQAVEAVERSQQRLLNQNKDLAAKLTGNEAERVRLEKQLENNRVEHAALLTRIEKNKLAQDSVAAAMGPIKKVLEAHQERQRKVN